MEETSAFLLCLTATSGVPLYCRSKGSSRQLPFSVIGSLNGVHMFANNQDVLLTSTRTTNSTVVWRTFHESINLIMMSCESTASEFSLNKLLENVFSAMVLVIGLDDLVNIKNVERLKKDLRACYKLIDSFLTESERMGDLTQCVDCIIAHDVAILQLVERFWKPVVDPIKSCLRVQLRSFPASVPLHRGILGLLLVNRDLNKSLYTVQAHPVEDMQRTEMKFTLEQRRAALRSFYTLVISRYFQAEHHDEKNMQYEETFSTGFSHSARQCYTVSTSHKCYAMKTELHLLFLLFKQEVPTFSMHAIANKTMQVFTKDFLF
ncbi:protein fuzzy homolog isoform X3 [Mixophyes fleayi]|uniref:protein fuzzy homolog isoform X3 n=1 Tax=Mixophyes fleayi TaxID=3061075 RepID=UPI003F4E0E8D